MRKVLALVLAVMLLALIPHPALATPVREPSYMQVFLGYMGLGESLTLGNYTLTLVDFLYNIHTGTNPVVLFKLRDNRNFTTVQFALRSEQSYTYGEVKVYLSYVKDATTRHPYALISVFSKPTTVFYGTTRANSTFSYGPVQLSLINVSNKTVFMRYYRDGFTDYAYFGVGNHYWHKVYIYVYNITNGSVTMKILAPKYIRYSLVPGAAVVIDNVSFTPVEVGGVFNLTVKVKNVGGSVARFVRVYLYSQPLVQGSEEAKITILPTVSLPSFRGAIPFAAYREGPIKYTSELAPGQEKALHFTLIASKVIEPDVYPLYLELQYGDENGVVKTETVQVGIPVNDVSRPKIIVESFKIEPNPVQPASNFTVFLTLRNTGNEEAYNVRVDVLPTKPREETQSYSLFPTAQEQPQEVDIYPIGRQSSLYFEAIPVNGTVKGRLYFALKDVSSGIYPLYVVVTYRNANGVEYKSQGTFGVSVGGVPKLKTYVGNVWLSEGKYNFEVAIANDGKVPARGVTVSVYSDVLSLFPLGERYVGSVEPMDYNTVNFVILNSSLKAGRYPITVRVTYMLPNGSFTSFTETLEVQIPANVSRSTERRYYYLGGVLFVLLVILLWRRGRG